MTQCKTKITYGNKSVGLLTWTSAMDCWSFSVPAGEACPMMRADNEDYICHGCYAMINRYNMPNVLNAQWVRYLWLKDHLKTLIGFKEVLRTFSLAFSEHINISEDGQKYFRWFDSGDIFSPRMAMLIHRLAVCHEDTKFWIPTRVWWPNLSDKWRKPLENLARLPNVALRPSALKYNESPPIVDWLDCKGSTVITSEEIEVAQKCPKTVNGGSCEANSCRGCWDKEHSVAYLVHAQMGKKKKPNAFSPKIVQLRNRIKEEMVQ